MGNNIAIIAGGTGLVGQHVVQYLLEDDFFEKVYILNRRSVHYDHPKAHEILTGFENIEEPLVGIRPTHAFCCLGTTIKKAGSKEAFRKVDHDYVLNFAKAVKSLGCNNFNVVTAMGTNSSSLIFYNQVKYEVSQALEKMDFSQLNIIQPSLLLGSRAENRLGEDIAQKFFSVTKKMWTGPLKNLAGIQGSQVAKAMVAISKLENYGINKYESAKLHDF